MDAEAALFPPLRGYEVEQALERDHDDLSSPMTEAWLLRTTWQRHPVMQWPRGRRCTRGWERLNSRGRLSCIRGSDVERKMGRRTGCQFLGPRLVKARPHPTPKMKTTLYLFPAYIFLLPLTSSLPSYPRLTRALNRILPLGDVPRMGALEARRSKDCATAAPGCTCAEITMAQPNWTVADLGFLASPRRAASSSSSSSGAGAGPGQPPPARIRFNLTNVAAGYEVTCAARGSGDDDGDGDDDLAGGDGDGDERWMTGTARRAPDRDDGVFRCADAPRKRPGSATFSFNRLTRVLAINQTWTCGGPGGQEML